MNHFLFYLVKVLAITYCLAFAIHFFADNGLKKIEGSIFQDWNNLLEGDINSELVILGSSRGAVSYNPEIFERITGLSSYNLSYNAGSYNLQYLKMETYLKRNKAPVVLIQNIDLSHFSRTNTIPEEFQFLPFLYNNDLRENLSELNNGYKIHKYVPLVKYNNHHSLLWQGILSGLGKDLKIYSTSKGYLPIDKPFKMDRHNLERLANLNSNPSSILDLYFQGLDSTTSFYKKKIPSSTKVFLVWAPEFKERRDTISAVTSLIRKEVRKRFRNMPNVFFLDYGDDPISEDSIYFYDTFHLNKKGSEIFSYKVSNDIKNILEQHAF